VPGLILAAVTPDNTPGGSVLTFAFPVVLFSVVAVILYLLFSRPHARVPVRRALAPARAGAPDPGAARAAAVAGGLPTASGGGGTESHLEPAGPPGAAGPAGPAAAADLAAGSVSERDDGTDDEHGRPASAADGTEASE
jgi:hypothetical protein